MLPGYSVDVDLFAQCNDWDLGRVFGGFLHQGFMADFDST